MLNAILKKLFLGIIYLILICNNPPIWAQSPKLVIPIGHQSFSGSDFMIISHNKKWIFTFDEDGNAYMWNSQTHQIQYNLKGHSREIKYAIISHNDSILATVSRDKSMILWSLYNGDSLARIKWVNNDWINFADFSPDDKQIVTGSSDGSIQLWRSNDGGIIRFRMNVHDAVSEVKFCNEGRSIISCGFDSLINLSSSDSLKVQKSYFYTHWQNKKVESFENISLTADNKILIASTFNAGVLAWNAETRELIKRYESQTRSPLVYTNKSPGFLYVSRSAEIKHVNLIAQTENVIAKDLKVGYLNISDDDSLIIASVEDSVIGIFDVNKFTHGISFKVKAKYPRVYIMPDKRFAAVCGDLYGNPEFYNLQSGELFSKLNAKVKDIGSSFFLPESKLLVFLEEDGVVKEMDLNTGKIKIQTATGKNIYRLKNISNDYYFVSSIKNEENEEYEFSIWDKKKNKSTLNYLSASQSASINKDRTLIVTALDRGQGVRLFNIKLKKEKELYSNDSKIRLLVSPFLSFMDMDRKVIMGSSENIEIFDIEDGKSMKIIEPVWGSLYARPNSIITSPNDSIFAIAGYESIRKYSTSKCEFFGKINIPGGYVNKVVFMDNTYCLIKNDASLKYINLNTGLVIWETDLGGDLIDANWEINLALIKNESGLQIFDLVSKKIKYSLIVTDNGGRIIYTDDYYYMAEKTGVNVLGFSQGFSRYDFDQFDLRNNRPDFVLKAMGNNDSSLIKSYYNAYLKRIKKAGFTTDKLTLNFEAPDILFSEINNIPIISKEPTVSVRIISADKLHQLDRLNIWLNGNPVFGQNGLSFKNRRIKSIDTVLIINLAEGKNKIQSSVLNNVGIESLREKIETFYQPEIRVKPKLIFIGLGVSKYKDETYNLKYADKDVKDISRTLKMKYPDVQIHLLMNEQVTLENIRELKLILLKTSADDKVILSFSGHGVIDSLYDFYFATFDINFSKPAERGLSYSQISWLLDSIPSVNKLVLMDACHSGELDKEEIINLEDSNIHPSNPNIKSTINTAKGSKFINTKDNFGLRNSFDLMQELFSNIGKGNGATIISAAAGNEFAYEGNSWNNGVFTYSVINGLTKNYADKDTNGKISVSELSEYVGQQVQILTKGNQKPTSRQINFDSDFYIW